MVNKISGNSWRKQFVCLGLCLSLLLSTIFPPIVEASSRRYLPTEVTTRLLGPYETATNQFLTSLGLSTPEQTWFNAIQLTGQSISERRIIVSELEQDISSESSEDDKKKLQSARDKLRSSLQRLNDLISKPPVKQNPRRNELIKLAQLYSNLLDRLHLKANELHMLRRNTPVRSRIELEFEIDDIAKRLFDLMTSRIFRARELSSLEVDPKFDVTMAKIDREISNLYKRLIMARVQVASSFLEKSTAATWTFGKTTAGIATLTAVFAVVQLFCCCCNVFSNLWTGLIDGDPVIRTFAAIIVVLIYVATFSTDPALTIENWRLDNRLKNQLYSLRVWNSAWDSKWKEIIRLASDTGFPLSDFDPGNIYAQSCAIEIESFVRNGTWPDETAAENWTPPGPPLPQDGIRRPDDRRR